MDIFFINGLVYSAEETSSFGDMEITLWEGSFCWLPLEGMVDLKLEDCRQSLER